MKAVHVELSHERGNIGMLEILPENPHISHADSHGSSRTDHIRKHFREFVAGGHDEALFGLRPRNKMCYVRVF